MPRVSYFAPTLCRLMNIPEPEVSTAEPVEKILSEAKHLLNGGPVERCLIFAPDAFGEFLFEGYAEWFEPVIDIAPIQVEASSELPSYTPVSYASMFTGADPRIHGITRYVKPVLSCDTLFDAIPRTGRSVALIAIDGCSNSIIFRGRPIDYFIEPRDSGIQPRALELVCEGVHDVLFVDRQEYDKAVHTTWPHSPEAFSSVRMIIDDFLVLAKAFLRRYSDQNRLVAFVTDHGAHLDPETGKGNHGSDSSLDVKIRHFWGIYEAESTV